jgi:hypothetical protein
LDTQFQYILFGALRVGSVCQVASRVVPSYAELIFSLVHDTTFTILLGVGVEAARMQSQRCFSNPGISGLENS